MMRRRNFARTLAAAFLLAVAAALLLLPPAPGHAQTNKEVWSATLTSANSWAGLGSVNYDGYGSDASQYVPSNHGSLSPNSFTIGVTTHTVEWLAVRETGDQALFFFTDTKLGKTELAGYFLELTVGGVKKTLQVSDATDGIDGPDVVGLFWTHAVHGYGASAWQTKTISVRLVKPSADVTYVSNIGQGSDDVHSYSEFRAQTFTTGSRTGGYTVTSVDIGSDDPEGNSFNVSIDFTNADGHPDGKLVELTRPASFTAGTLTFTAPPYTVLEPNTTYALTIKTIGANTVVDLDTTLSNGEDAGRTSGWSIGNTALRFATVWGGTATGESIRIAINGPANPARGAPTITGTAQVGETLTAGTSDISDADGLISSVYTYQWIRVDGGTDDQITGATSSTYVPVAADAGKTIRVRVRFTDDLDYAEERTSAATDAVEPETQEAQGAADDDAAEPTDRPHGLTAEASGGAVVLTWKAPEGYRSDYRILRNRPELGEAEPLVYVAYTDTTDVTYTDTDVEPGVLYVYSVTALDFLGDAGEASRPVEIRMQATSQQQTANSPATGAPAISGTAQVGETLTADTSGISDADGLTSAAFSYQWQAGGADISGATGSTYTLADADEGAAISVTVSFTDNAGNDETLTSAATEAVAAVPLPQLTAVIENAAASHDGESVFTFELRFSEEFGISYKTLRDHAFTVTGGTVRKAQRLEQGSDIGWRITVRPDGNGDVTIVLPETTDCDAQGAICTDDGRMLSNELKLTVSGP